MKGSFKNSKRRSTSSYSDQLKALDDALGLADLDDGSRLKPYWREWAAMGAFLKTDRGLDKALEYLINHKFLGCFSEGSPDQINFAREIRRLFTPDELRPYFKKLMRTRQPDELARLHRARRLLFGE